MPGSRQMTKRFCSRPPRSRRDWHGNGAPWLLRKSFRQFPSTDFAPLVRRDRIDHENTFRHLPRAQTVSTKVQELGFAKACPEPGRRIDISYYIGGDFFISER